MTLKEMGAEYLKSAKPLKERIDYLKAMKKTQSYEDQKLLEDRIVLLTAEYYHLIRTANYLSTYYDGRDEACR